MQALKYRDESWEKSNRTLGSWHSFGNKPKRESFRYDALERSTDNANSIKSLWTRSNIKLAIADCKYNEQNLEALHSPLKSKFNEYAEAWYNDTSFISSVDKIVMHPAYQKIIGMGTDALPYIFEELNKTHDHWLWALVAITGRDVAQPEHNFMDAVNAWLEWGKENGYL